MTAIGSLQFTLHRYLSAVACRGQQARSWLPNRFCDLPLELLYQILLEWCGDAKDVLNLDSAMCNHQYRGLYLQLLSSYDLSSLFVEIVDIAANYEACLDWLQRRKARVSSLSVSVDSITRKRGGRALLALDLHALRILRLAAGSRRSHKSRNRELGYAQWGEVLRNCRALRELDLSTCSACLPELARALACPLHSLRLRFQPLSFSSVQVLQPVSGSLTSLHLIQCEMSDAVLRQLLRACPAVTECTIAACSSLSVQSLLVVLHSLPQLERLHFSLPRACEGVGAGLDAAALPPSLALRALDLPVAGLSFDFLVSAVVSAPQLQEIKSLRLSVTQCKIGLELALVDARTLSRDHQFLLLQRFGSRLGAVEATDMTAEQVSGLFRACDDLHTVRLARCALTNPCIDLLAQRCPHLRDLRLHACAGLRDDHLTALARACPEVAECRVPGNVAISDVSLKSFHNWPRLQLLDVCRCALVSDEGILDVIKHCPMLQHLFAAHTRLSPMILQRLQQDFSFIHV